jgi:nucleotide-binding universal stress UspA family protein
MRRLLIGFDDSPGAPGALRYGARAALRNRCCLVVVSVVVEPIEVVAAWPFVFGAPGATSPEQFALDRLRAAVEQLSTDISVVTIVCRGRVGPVLAREAARHLCDAIVIGAPSGVWSRLTGGVARYLRAHSASAVVVVPKHGP